MKNKENKSDLRFEQEDDAVWVFSGGSHQGTEISHLITSHIDDYNEDDVRLICHYAANEIDRLRAKLAKATPEVLDAPARVGGGVFREGVKWKTVIESAQRLYEYSKDEIKPIVSPADMLKIANGELVLVPKEATKEMIERGYEAHDCFFTLGSVRNVWDAMIEAQEQSHEH
ncbi:hypothetical protein F938_00832 [Acinetobacter bereziniae LMG 1003 = CIP 70.12]|uniref:Uncharacterized protein n=1 Tax=Acinetobacter bereziniae LMG 1003 = CIP 70.12 TaxID=981324 RepID=N9DPL2_ACIBZ|nr:hypothetical protein [Acinetobacter bereziniae]ENW00188.1 hypothetical protein F938_00832 [Acinetobacter bereziniae LMG 1003 = CIP 70.12]